MKLTHLLSLAAGSLDFLTGLALVFAPETALNLMHVPAPTVDALTYLRFVGAFVAAVGASYLWSLWRSEALLRANLELTILYRLAAGTFVAVAILQQRLALAWWSVPVTDFALAGFQSWLLQPRSAPDEHTRT